MIQQSHPQVYIWEENENSNSKTYMFIAALFISAKIWKQSKSLSTGEWIKMVCIYNEYYPTTKKEKKMKFYLYSNTDGPREQYEKSEILYDTTYMWNLKNNTNVCECKTETNSQTQKTKQWLPKGEGKDEEQIRSVRLTDTSYNI